MRGEREGMTKENMTKESNAGNYSFQVDLKGIIRLLSENLYSSEDVFLRELLQNGVDAIEARRGVGGKLHLFQPTAGGSPACKTYFIFKMFKPRRLTWKNKIWHMAELGKIFSFFIDSYYLLYYNFYNTFPFLTGRTIQNRIGQPGKIYPPVRFS